MSSADLLFGRAPAANGDLVLGEPREGPTPERVDIDVIATLGAPTLAAAVGLAYYATVAATLAPPTLDAQAAYRSNTDRPLVATLPSSWREGAAVESGADAAFQLAAQRLTNGADAQWQRAEHRSAETAAVHREASRGTRQQTAAPWRTAAPRHAAPAAFLWRNGDRSRRQVIEAPWRNGQALQRGADLPWRNGDRSRRRVVEAAHRTAEPLRKIYEARYGGRATPLHRGWQVDWRNAIKPPAGTSTGPEPPEPPHACYTPSGHLVFDRAWVAGLQHLVFTCDEVEPPLPPATVTVPIRRVYMLLNSAVLKRVEGNLPIFCTSMSLSLDVDSWAWSFSAAIPMAAQDLVEPNLAGDPVELEATINGVSVRLLAESISRERAFGEMPMVRVNGRSKIALLDAPFAAVMNFNNDGGARTLTQLMDETLEINGVSIGWNVDATALDEDWLVPAGLWNHQGTHIAALNALAAAAGAYVQPHGTAQTVRILPRFPVAPWEWGSVTPDYELPAAATTREGIAWVDKPVYNRVFVAGQGAGGVKGRVTRAGSDGSLVAPMVVDPLITAAAAARQRGLPILADVGRQADLTLKLGVLAETGIILPGKFVRYVDGSTVRLGITRRLGVEVAGEQIWQSIGVQTYVSV